MHAHLRSLSLRGRLIILGGGATAVLLVLTLASTLLMSSFRTLAHTNASREEQARTLSHAYESWIYNDDQNNMYVAVMALKDPSKLKVAERTWQQSLAAYHESESQLSKLRREVRDPAMLVQLSAIQANLALYNGFSRQMRAAAVAGNVDKSVYIATVANLKPSDALPVEFSNLRNAIENKETQSTASVRSRASTGTTLILLVAGIGLPLLLLLVWTTIRSIMSGVGHVKERVDALSHAMVENLRPGLSALANGDFTHRLSARTKPEEITRHDELGQIMRTTEHMREAILECYDAYNRSAEQLADVIRQVSSTAHTLDGASQQMATSSEETGRATAEVAQAIEHVALGAERQVQMMDSAKRAADEVTAAVDETAREAEQTAEAASRARELAQEGVLAAEQADAAMQSVRDSSQSVSDAIGELSKKSEHIGAIVATITGIAEQTNLLALNAAIEAARAGEQGRGFAVVAEEVRKLAEESQHAAREIAELVAAIQSDTSSAVQVVSEGTQRTVDGAGVVEQAREAFLSIGQAVDDITTRIEHIAAAAEEVTATAASMQSSITEAAAVAEQSSASAQEVSASTEETSASSTQIATSAQDLAHSAATLDELVTRFQVSEAH